MPLNPLKKFSNYFLTDNARAVLLHISKAFRRATYSKPKSHTMKIKDIRALLIELKSSVGDDYRASDDPDDTTPGMQVTIATTDGKAWTYQTGDNSYSGSCYHYRHWHVLSLYRRSDCTALAREAVSELLGMVEEEKSYQPDPAKVREEVYSNDNH